MNGPSDFSTAGLLCSDQLRGRDRQCRLCSLIVRVPVARFARPYTTENFGVSAVSSKPSLHRKREEKREGGGVAPNNLRYIRSETSRASAL